MNTTMLLQLAAELRERAAAAAAAERADLLYLAEEYEAAVKFELVNKDRDKTRLFAVKLPK